MGKYLADITPLRESPAFRRLWLGSAVASVGSQLTLVAVSLEVYRLTQDSLYVGLLSILPSSRWSSAACWAARSPMPMTGARWPCWPPRCSG